MKFRRLSERAFGVSSLETDVQPAANDAKNAQQPGTMQSPLARFCYDSSHFSAVQNRVKKGAFMPAPDLSLSVFIMSGTVAMMHEHGAKWAMRAGNPPKAFAEIAVQSVLDQKLSIHRDDHPPLHANVNGWPPHTEKSLQMLIAQE